MNTRRVVALGFILTAVGSATQAGDWGLISDPAVLARSANMPAYTVEQIGEQPKPAKDLGAVWAAVCTFQDDQKISQAAVLSQLRARAAIKGANAIVNIRFMIYANARSSCWHRGYTATGEAVVVD
jgi:hypothetical protein